MEMLKKFLENELNLDSAEILKKILNYEKHLFQWNSKVNLVSRKTVSIEEHVLNSIFFLTKYNFSKVRRFADIGTGGGFPGIPLKLLFPETEVTFVDSIQKKMNALEDIVNNLGLSSTKVICARAEEISSDKVFKEKYDAVISKAVAPLENLAVWGRNFLNIHGEILCIKGGNISDELETLHKLKYKFDVKVVNFAFNSIYKIKDKKLVIIRKIS